MGEYKFWDIEAWFNAPVREEAMCPCDRCRRPPDEEGEDPK